MSTQNEARFVERASRRITPTSQIVNQIRNNIRTDGRELTVLRPGISEGLQALPGFGSKELPSGNNSDISNIRIYEQSTGAYVNFKVAPEISESKSVNYIEVSEIRKAGSIMVFIGSPSRNFTINAKLVSRTQEEAAENFKKLNLMKSWAMPDNDYESEGIGGDRIDSMAPTVLYIYGYGRNFKGVQVVMKSINHEYPTDVDYIPIAQGSKTKMPIIMPVSMTFQEIRSGEELQHFDINAYKLGQLEHW